MKKKSYTINPDLMGAKLKHLRLTAGKTQDEVAEILTAKYGTPISKMAIAAYEQGKRIPSLAVAMALCQLFSIKPETLFLDAELEYGENPVQGLASAQRADTGYSVERSKFAQLEGEPVFITAKEDGKFLPQWGILEHSKRHVITTSGAIPFSEIGDVRSHSTIRTTIRHEESLVQAETVEVQSLANAPEARHIINGRYRVEAKDSILVGIDNGFVLRFAGLNKTYLAYR